jgi:hypothetical protein
VEVDLVVDTHWEVIRCAPPSVFRRGKCVASGPDIVVLDLGCRGEEV